MVASLFLSVSKEDFAKHVKNMYIDIARKSAMCRWKWPTMAMSPPGRHELEEGNLLGIAMGTSEAGGYVDEHMNITGWLNELAFAPVDFNTEAMVDDGRAITAAASSISRRTALSS